MISKNITNQELGQLKIDLFKSAHILNNQSFENKFKESERCDLVKCIWAFCGISSDEIDKECDMWESDNSGAGLQCPDCGKLMSHSATAEHHQRYR